jgi:O-acetyl-ADP-ribose deacetylase (regulator of RNase III)
MHEFIPDFAYTCTGDITQFNAEVIVNAANSTLLGGGGVDGAIHRAAGPELLDECRSIRQTQYPEGLPTGEAVITGAGKMQMKAVIHTVGPVWHGGTDGEQLLLEHAYTNSLDIAHAERFRSIAFPAISTGVYRFPKELAAGIVFTSLLHWHRNHPDAKLKVYLVFFSSSDQQLFDAVVSRERES